MSDWLRRVPDLPRPVPALSSGERVEGSEVINCQIRISSASAAQQGESTPVQLRPEGLWEVVVSAAGSPVTDFLDSSVDSRLTDDGWRSAGAQLIRRLTSVVEVHPVRAKRHLVQIKVPAQTTRRQLRNLAQGLVSSASPLAISRRDPAPAVRDIRIDLTEVDNGIAASAERELHIGSVLGEATALARDLDSLPEATATADWWRRESKGLLGSLAGTRVKVRGQGWLERKGFGGLLSVCADPMTDAALVEAVWDPAAAEGELTDDDPDVVIVGGAQIPAVIRALAQFRSPQKVIGLIPVTGGPVPPRGVAPGRPQQVVEHVGGLTTRVDVHPDEFRRLQFAARLAMADTLAYATSRHHPRHVISVGPTTSAAMTALGARTGALFTADPELARRLTLRGAKVGEPWWPMPLPEYLEKAIDGDSADLAGEPDGPAALTAALYLGRFTGEVSHIHLDTTGPARAGAGRLDQAPGATGFAARTLVEWLRR